ncbi:MAG: response regulator transcription factor [Pseudomonadota bacterium]
MNTPRHLFLSSKGTLSARWRAAFPAARALAWPSAAIPAAATDVIWLHLRADPSLAQQLAVVRVAFPTQFVVVLSDRPNDDQALAAFSASARGYCNSHAVAEVLQQVALVVSQGGLWIGEALMQRLLLGTARLPPPTPATLSATIAGVVSPAASHWIASLTEREREVARTVAAGASNKEIARQLGITERTVKAHVGAIFEKLKVRDRLQLALTVRASGVE